MMKLSRKLSSYFLSNGSQLKYAAIISGVFLCFSAVHYWLLSTLFLEIQQGLPSDNEVFLNSIFEKFLLSFSFIVFFSAVLLFLIMVVITHRFLGPLIPISRALKEYFENCSAEQIVIRKTDELHDFVAFLNSKLGERRHDANSKK